MDLHSFKKNLPLLVAILLIFGIAITIGLIQQGVFFVTKARPTSVPENVQITNVSDSSFTVVFTTGLSSPAAIRLSEGTTGNTIILDDRDKSTGTQNDYFSHHITIPNLEPQKTYAFIIISDGKEYRKEGEYLVSTGLTIENPPPSQNPLYGKVLLPHGEGAPDTIVTAHTENSQIISSVTNEDGTYIIPTNSLKLENFSNYVLLDQDSPVFLNFIREELEAAITTNYQIGQNLPAITLNQQYAFSTTNEALMRPNTSPNGDGLGELNEIATPSQAGSVTTPRNTQSYIDQRPEFSGTGGPGRIVTISIPQLNLTTTTQISEQGQWSYRPQENLPQGDYAISFEVPDENGIQLRISRDISILASGSQITEDATPSATPTFTPSPILTPSVSITLSPTQSPTLTTSPSPTGMLPTATPTTAQTLTPNPTIFIPTTTPLPPIEKPGTVSQTVILGIASIILIIAGAAIFFAL